MFLQYCIVPGFGSAPQKRKAEILHIVPFPHPPVLAGKSSTLIAIMNALGTDCTRDFMEVHRELSMWPKIKEQLRGFRIGRLPPSPQASPAAERLEFRTWEALLAMGRVPDRPAAAAASPIHSGPPPAPA